MFRVLAVRAAHLVLLAVFLTAATTTTLGYVRWVSGKQFFPRLSEAQALRRLAGPAGTWLPQVLSATRPDADLLYVPFADPLDDRDWAAAYYLYPRRLHVRPVQFRDRPSMAQQDVRAGYTQVLADGHLFTLPGWRPQATSGGHPISPVPDPVSVRGLLAWFLTIATALGLGSAALRWLDPPLGTGAGSCCLRVGLALAVGLGAIGTLGFFGAMFGAAGSPPLVLGATVAGMLALFPSRRWLRPARRPPMPVDTRGEPEPRPAAPATSTVTGSPRTRRAQRIVQITLAVWLAAMVTVPMLRAISEPMLHWDERFQWAYKGKILLEEGGMNGASFQHLDRPHLHRHYPLLVPALEAHLARLAGGFAQERAVKTIFPGFMLAVILTVYGMSRRHLDATPALLLAGTLAALPPLHHATRIQGGPAHTGFADLPLAMFITAAAAATALWLAATARRSARDEGTHPSGTTAHRLIWIAAAMAGFAFLTKPEGMTSIAALLAIVGTRTVTLASSGAHGGDHSPPRWRSRLVPLAAATFIFTVLAIPRLWLESSVPTTGTVGYTGDADYISRLTGPGLVSAFHDNFWPAVRALIAAPFSWRWSGFAWLPLLGLLVTPLMPRRSSHLLALFLLVPLAADLIAFTLTGSEITWHLAVALDRVWIQVLGPIFLISAGQLSLPAGSTVWGRVSVA